MFEVIKQGAVIVVAGDQPIDCDAAPRLRELLEEACRKGQPMVVVDLQDVPLMDSSGLECLVECNQLAEERGGILKLAGANPLCNDILRVTGLAERLETYSDARMAVRSFAR